MRLDFLQPLLSVPGPYATAYVDVTRAHENAAHEVELRWRALRQQLADSGAPEDLLEEMGQTVLAPTGHAGAHGLVVLGAGKEVVFMRVLPHPPQPDEAVWEPLPHLVPMVRQLVWQVPHLLVVADRGGADVVAFSPLGDRIQEEQVEGSKAPLRKQSVAMGELHVQHRVENLWERNAEEVAKTVSRLVAQLAPRLVALAGDQRALTELREQLGTRAGSMAVDLDTGGRAAGTDDEKLREALAQAVREQAQREASEVLDQYEQERGRHGAAVEGVAAVVEALRKAQVEALLLADRTDAAANTDAPVDAGDGPRTLYAGADPFQVGISEEEVRALGAEEVWQVRAESALLRGATATDASALLVPEGGPALAEDVAALLRYADASTAS